MIQRVVALSVLQAGLAAFTVLGPLSGLGAGPLELGLFAAAFAAVGLAPIHLELRRHACTVVMVEAVLVAALFSVGPAGVVLIVAMGEAVACCVSRQQPLKMAFNVTGAAQAAAVSAGVFVLLGAGGAAEPSSWLVALAAAASFAVVNLLPTAAVLAAGEGRRIREVLRASSPSALTASGASATLGLTAAALFGSHPLAPLLMAPLLAAVVVGTRSLARQSAERLRFQRLYEASSRSSCLAGFDATLSALAAEARGLVTGSAAVCGAARADGTWVGVIVDDEGPRPAPDAAMDAVAELASSSVSGSFEVEQLPIPLRSALPAGVRLLVASPQPGGRADVVLAVVREITGDEQDATRLTVLSAFAGHAALSVANAVLYEEVEEALRHQLDLSRQKDEFLAAVSHELRTPLTSVLGAVKTVRRLNERMDAAQRDKMLATAVDQGTRLARLIEELLLVAATEQCTIGTSTSSVDVESFLRSVVSELGSRTEDRVAIDACGSGDVTTDSVKLARVLTELIENALKYASGSPVDVRAERTDSHVQLYVDDHGPGIPSEDRQRVFERFVQLDQSATRRHGGTGLGLYLCRQLVDLLGGSLTFGETPGGGCSAMLSLPVGPVPSPAVGAAAVNDPARQLLFTGSTP